jgi:hypothetical protein
MYADLKHYFVNLVVVVFGENGMCTKLGGNYKGFPNLSKGFEYPLDSCKP